MRCTLPYMFAASDAYLALLAVYKANARADAALFAARVAELLAGVGRPAADVPDTDVALFCTTHLHATQGRGEFTDSWPVIFSHIQWWACGVCGAAGKSAAFLRVVRCRPPALEHAPETFNKAALGPGVGRLPSRGRGLVYFLCSRRAPSAEQALEAVENSVAGWYLALRAANVGRRVGGALRGRPGSLVRLVARGPQAPTPSSSWTTRPWCRRLPRGCRPNSAWPLPPRSSQTRSTNCASDRNVVPYCNSTVPY